jgi:hypothetical protein
MHIYGRNGFQWGMVACPRLHAGMGESRLKAVLPAIIRSHKARASFVRTR